MTREEVEATLKQARKFGGYGLEPYFESLLAHDQAQRAVIDRYREQVDEQAADIIGHIDEKHKLNKQTEQQAKEIGELRQACALRHQEIERRTMQVGTLREALQLLYDCQNGCPLPKYEKDWNRAMELAQKALKECV